MARKNRKAGYDKAYGSPKPHNFTSPNGCFLSLLDPRPNLPFEHIQRHKMRRITRA